MATPTLDQLTVFDAVVRSGSFAGAARTLHRVPSAVSYAIKGLEDALDVPVFDRSGHRAVLTPAGQRLLRHARDVLENVHTLDAVARDLRGAWEPELRIVIDGALPQDRLMAALRQVADAGAPTHVRVDVAYQEGVPDLFLHDDGDLMLLLDADESAANLPTHLLDPLEMVLVTATSHPLASMQPVPKSSLDAHISLVVRDSARHFQQVPRAAFLPTARLMHTSDFPSKRQALLAGVGFGWMPMHLVATDLDNGALAEVAFEGGSRWTYAPRLVTRADRPLGRAGTMVREAVVQGTTGAR